MIQKPNGWDNARAYSDGGEVLPPGGYVVKILNTKIEQYSWGQVLILQIDINEGEFFEFYKKQWEDQTQEDKKWKGTFRINLPKGDGTEQDGWTMRSMKTSIAAIEDSNDGYHWDWNEQSLKNKIVGALFNRKEFANDNGEVITFTQCKRLIDAEKIRTGKFKLPKDEPLKDKPTQTQTGTGQMIPGFQNTTDDDIPF